jgi:predicted phosphodiesterase
LARNRKKITLEVPTERNAIRFGLIGDTQFGSLYEAKDCLKAFYDRIAKEGISLVLHTGDVLDGHRVYKGQEFELHALGWQKQRDWFAQVAPKVENVTTYFVTGNHDLSLKKLAGIDVGPELEHVRPDWKFVGEDSGIVTLTTKEGHELVVMLLHPGGGSAYAVSYRAQKIVEQIEGGRKPHIIGIGHYHKADFMPSYRNVGVIQSGCFQFQTPFMLTRGLAAHVGGWIVRVVPGDFQMAISAEFVAFYADPKREAA